MKVLLSLTVCVVAAVARPDAPPAAYAPAAPAYPSNNYGANEDRDGYATSGSYYVALPDGRLQKVTYSVNGDGGYVADVTYEGEAVYPEVKPYAPPAPAYKPAAY